MKTRLESLCEKLEAGPWQPAGGWRTTRILNNHELLIGAGLRDKSLPLAAVATELLAQRQPDTVRGIMYAVVSVGWLPDTGDKSYSAIQRLLNTLRKRGVLPYSWIVDTIRATQKPSSWSGLDDFADTVAGAYRRDFWASLPEYVCIVCEKDTAGGRIAPVTREYDVALHPLRGFSSTSFAYGIGEEWREIEKPIHCYYIGDHDPSGRKIEDDMQTRLKGYTNKPFTWTRLAVEPSQFDEFNIIPLEPKKNDTRYRKFAARYGDACAEVEAIPADALRDMVRKAIEAHIPAGRWEALKAIEAEEKRQWHEVMRQFKAA